MNEFGNSHGLSCASNDRNRAHHIWHRLDAAGRMGATACVVVTRFIPYYERTGDWEAMAWWVHDHLPYNAMKFFPRYAAFNLNWREEPERRNHQHGPAAPGQVDRAGDA